MRAQGQFAAIYENVGMLIGNLVGGAVLTFIVGLIKPKTAMS
jgi:hypothetical protein